MTFQKLEWLNVAKGIGILLVVMGHTMFPIHEAISIFHMPLFFFLSGVTLKETTEAGVFISKKIDRIAIPYLFYSCLSFVIARSIGYEGNVFNGPLWFLQTLFLGILVSYYVVRYLNNRWQWFVIALFAIYGYVVVTTNFTMFPYDRSFDRVIRSAIFILLGYKLKSVVLYEPMAHTMVWNLAITTALALLFAFLCYVSIFILGAHGGFLEGDICKFNIFLFYATAITGILCVIYFSKLIKNSKIFTWIGVNLMTIMCLHYPLLQCWNPIVSSFHLSNMGKGIVAIGTYILVIAICVPFAYIFKRYIPRLTGYKPLISTKE